METYTHSVPRTGHCNRASTIIRLVGISFYLGNLSFLISNLVSRMLLSVLKLPNIFLRSMLLGKLVLFRLDTHVRLYYLVYKYLLTSMFKNLHLCKSVNLSKSLYLRVVESRFVFDTHTHTHMDDKFIFSGA